MGVFAVLRKGLDVVAADPKLVLFPIVLDLFLWFGPRLSSSALFQQISELMKESFRSAPALDVEVNQQMTEQLDLFVELLAEFGSRFNLFWGLSSYPVAVPSSMVGLLPLIPGRMPYENPLGRPMAIEIPMSIPSMVLLSLPILALGLGMGTLYHRWIAAGVDPESQVVPFVKGWVRILLLTALLGTAAFTTGFGILFVVGLINLLFGQQVGVLFLGLGLSLLLGAGIYVFFAPFAVVRQRTVQRAMLESFNVVRVNMVGTLFFLLSSGGLLYLTNMVWLMPGDSSWYALLGVLGHAFISTVLIASGYIFYQNRIEFLEEIKKKLFSAQMS